mmetsp:Transcript_19553/g.27482  ORF Transcript_19553/g.27482 Transcript_19553/m.27482 type:complete len:135 (-) Transcript_19553:9-413(-)
MCPITKNVPSNSENAENCLIALKNPITERNLIQIRRSDKQSLKLKKNRRLLYKAIQNSSPGNICGSEKAEVSTKSCPNLAEKNLNLVISSQNNRSNSINIVRTDGSFHRVPHRNRFESKRKSKVWSNCFSLKCK